MAGAAVGSAFYASLLTFFVTRFVCAPISDDRLRTRNSSEVLTRWFIVAGLLTLWGFIYGIAYGGVSPGGRARAGVEAARR